MYWIWAVTMSASGFSEGSSVHRMGKTAKVNAAARTAYASRSYVRWVWRRDLITGDARDADIRRGEHHEHDQHDRGNGGRGAEVEAGVGVVERQQREHVRRQAGAAVGQNDHQIGRIHQADSPQD